MKKKRAQPADAAALRRQAEAKLSEHKKKAAASPALDADSLRLVHELQVHQIELQLQNEELMQSRAELEEAYRQFSNLYDFAPVGYFTLARDGTIHDANLAGAKLLQVERGKLIKRRFGLFVSIQSYATFSAFFEKLLSGYGEKNCELALLKNGNAMFWGRLEATCFEGGQECRAVLVDITARKRAEEALRQSEEHFRNLVYGLPDAVYTLELPAQKVTYFNQDTFLGYSRSELMADHSILSLLHPEDTPVVLTQWERIINGETLAPMEYRVRNRAGDWEWLENRWVVQVRNAEGMPTQIMIILTTITERKQAEEALRQLSTHDALTNLYSRGFFMEEMARLERGRKFPVSIVMADVDHLKETNDQQGHAAGDALLKHVAQALAAAFRAEDLVARIGGDEFAVLLPNTDAAAAGVSLQRVRQVIQENNAAHTGTQIRLSLGVSTAENPMPLSSVLQEADANMYREKRGRATS